VLVFHFPFEKIEKIVKKKFSPEIEIFSRNRNFDEKYKLWSDKKHLIKYNKIGTK